MARERKFTLKLSLGELQAMQLILEQAAMVAPPDQVDELERVDGKLYALLFPAVVDETGKRAKNPPGALHPMPLLTLRLIASDEVQRAR